MLEITQHHFTTISPSYTQIATTTVKTSSPPAITISLTDYKTSFMLVKTVIKFDHKLIGPQERSIVITISG